MELSINFGPERKLTTAQAAEYVGLSERAFRQRLYQGEVRYFKIGKRVILKLADLDEFLERHSHGLFDVKKAAAKVLKR